MRCHGLTCVHCFDIDTLRPSHHMTTHFTLSSFTEAYENTVGFYRTLLSSHPNSCKVHVKSFPSNCNDILISFALCSGLYSTCVGHHLIATVLLCHLVGSTVIGLHNSACVDDNWPHSSLRTCLTVLHMFVTPGAQIPPMRFTSLTNLPLVICADRPALLANAIGD